MSEENKTVELIDKPEVKVPEKETATREDLKAKGWSEKELDSAEKRGMFKVQEKKEEKTEEKTPPENKGKRAEDKLPGNFLDEMDKELSPAQEKMFLEMFPPGTKPRAFYFRAKNERLARQRAEQERDKLALELQLRKDGEQKRFVEDEQEVDENGNPVDPEDKPLTMKQLKKLREQEQAEINRKQKELNERTGKVTEAMQAQEEYAKSVHSDFDDTVRLATELVNNLELIPEKWKRDKILRLVRELQITAAQADKLAVDDYTASMISYEIGQFHPKYGKPSEGDAETDEAKKKASKNGDLTPEQMERIKENAQRRTPSASLPGSNGRRSVNVDDLTIKDVLAMSPEARYKFKKDHPAKMAELLRGKK